MAQEVERQIDLIFKSANLALTGITTFSGVVLQTLKYTGNTDPAAEALVKYINKGGNLSFSMCQPEQADAIALKFEEAGVTVVRSDGNIFGGATAFVFASADDRLVKQALDEYRAEQGIGGITAKSVVYNQAKGDVRRLDNLDMHEAMLFSAHSSEMGINIAINEPSSGNYSMTFATRNKQVIDNIKATVAVELTGDAGDALRKQLQYENDNAMRISARVQDEKDSFYIVDLDHTVIKIEEDNLVYKGRDGNIRLSRTDSDFNNKCTALIGSMRGPVDIESKEIKMYQSADRKKRKEFLVKKDKEHGRPQYTVEEVEAIKKLQAARELYEEKLSRDNPDMEILNYSYTNDEMRMATFDAYERINEEAIHDKEEMDASIDPILFDDARSRFRGYQDVAEEIPLKAQEYAENIIEDNPLDEFNRNSNFDDVMLDSIYDMNNNGIPDELESPTHYDER